MAKLTQEEMMVLNSLIYIDTDKDVWNESGEKQEKPKTLLNIVEELEKELKQSNREQVFKEMDSEKCQDIFHAIRESSSLRELEYVHVKKSDYEEYHTQPSDARTLAFKNGDNPVVVFRGTTGDQEGQDNLEGGIQTDTDAQKRALAYINILHDKYGFDNISVSGHSKGGNKAMYVSVLSDYVDDCTAFDAQGFSVGFLGKYSREIAKKKDKITLFMTDQSVVGNLLFSIAGNVVCISVKDLPMEPTLMGVIRHVPTIFYTVGEGGEIVSRSGSSPSQWQRMISDITTMASLIVCMKDLDHEEGKAVFQMLASKIAEDYTKKNFDIISNWVKGEKSDGSPAFSTQLAGYLMGMLPGMPETVQERLTAILCTFDSDTELDPAVVLKSMGEKMRLLVTELPASSITAGQIPVVVVITGVWAVVKILELAIPMLINAGITEREAAGLALVMAASWIIETLGGLAEAVGGFISNMVSFFQSMVNGIGEWINGIFGSAVAAISYAQDITVTMSRIEELQRLVSNLSQSYNDTDRLAKNSYTTVSRVYGYYSESYVRSCCRDIQNDLKNAQKYADMVQKELARKRKVLLEAAESYRRADREAAQAIRNYA